jgi:hypothetical protein
LRSDTDSVVLPFTNHLLAIASRRMRRFFISFIILFLIVVLGNSLKYSLYLIDNI